MDYAHTTISIHAIESVEIENSKQNDKTFKLITLKIRQCNGQLVELKLSSGNPEAIPYIFLNEQAIRNWVTEQDLLVDKEVMA